MAKINIDSAPSSGGSGGNLQLLNGAAMDATLRAVADTANTASPLLLSTTLVQTTSTLKITTADNPYIDAEDNSGNNRFTVGRDPLSQQVNVDFASNPTGSTTAVGAIRTYADGVNLSEAMTFREDGNVGINTNTPGAKLDVHSASNVVAQFNRTGTGKSWIQYLQAGTGRWNTGYDNTNGNFTIYDAVNSLDRLVVSDAGNVGIGTTAPITKLDVSGTLSSVFSLRNGATNFLTTRSSGIGGTDTGLRIWDNSNNFTLDLYGSGSYDHPQRHRFYIGGSAGERLLIGSSTAATIKGSGSTSATTALLVQDSAATNLMSLRDDGIMTLFAASKVGQLDIQGGANSGVYAKAYNSQSDNIIRYKDYNGNQCMTLTMTGSGAGALVVNSATNNASAVLQADSTTKGFLPPRMTNAQRAAIATPAVGLMVYCTDAVEGLYVYKSTGWTFVI